MGKTTKERAAKLRARRKKDGVKPIQLILSPDILQQIDEMSGKVPRATFVRHLLEQAIKQQGGVNA